MKGIISKIGVIIWIQRVIFMYQVFQVEEIVMDVLNIEMDIAFNQMER
ncbi:MAG: hypothetical protein KIS69_10270 [Bacteroidetes bacterium]|nr:hypothetical protein [Bacteroidota bacterium]